MGHLVVADATEQLADLYLINYHEDQRFNSLAEAGSDERSFHKKRRDELEKLYEEKYATGTDWFNTRLYDDNVREMEAWAQR